MSQIAGESGSAVTVKPQSNIYTLLVAIAIVALLVTIVVVLSGLLTPLEKGGYGLEFGALFDPDKFPADPGIRPLPK